MSSLRSDGGSGDGGPRSDGSEPRAGGSRVTGARGSSGDGSTGDGDDSRVRKRSRVDSNKDHVAYDQDHEIEDITTDQEDVGESSPIFHSL